MNAFLQTLVNALALGSLYALIALGYTLVYGVLRFINFAHSDIFMIGAWMSYVLTGWLGWKVGAPAYALPVVLVGAMGFCALLAVVIEQGAYKPLRKAPRLNVLITAIGISLLLQNTGLLPSVFGASPQRMPALVNDRVLFHLGGVGIQFVDVMVVALAGSLMLVLQWMVFHTRLGRAMRAVSFDERTAALMGIHVNRVVSITFAIGSALAAAAGLLYALKYGALKQSADATWVLLGLKAFVAAVIGGIGNVRGAVAGGLLIGFLELFGASYFSPHLRDVYVFAVLIAVLLFKPSGLFGKALVEKV